MARYIKRDCSRTSRVLNFRTIHVLTLALFLLFLIPFRASADGWCPTDAGLVVNLETSDQILLSIWIDLDEDGVEDEGEEFFLVDLPSWQPNDSDISPFNYSGYGNYIKLRPQTAGATTPSEYSKWTIKEPLTHTKTIPPGESSGFTLDGICYTMWSSDLGGGNPSKTLYANSGFKFLGDLKNSTTDNNLCDVVFVVPTVQARKNMDPNNTLGKKVGTQWAFDGATGVGFAGMVYREVYMFMKPRDNEPFSYEHMALVTFNTTDATQYWGDVEGGSKNNTVYPGRAAYAFADTKHNRTIRTLFRLYIIEGHSFGYCPDSYFFAHDEQDYVRYRDNHSSKPVHYSDYRKIYTTDHHHCMERIGTTSLHQTGPFIIPSSDSTYYYVGKNQEYYSSTKGKSLAGDNNDPKAYSQFRQIRQMRVRGLKDADTTFTPPVGACGRIIVDTTAHEENLGATFEPEGYFLKVSTGRNVRMIQTGPNEWTTEEAWSITPEWANLTIKATLFTGENFSETDLGADIVDWSKMIKGTDVPVAGMPGETAVGKTGRARIYTNRADSNGGLEFVLADSTKFIRYHNNGHFGSEIPTQYATTASSIMNIQAPRLLDGYHFICWTNVADTTVGPFTKYNVYDIVDLDTIPLVGGKHVLDLYAQAAYQGIINVALSFTQDGARYFMTQPNHTAPRFERARTFSDWTNVYQGMSDAENTLPNYLSSYSIIGNPGDCIECAPGEYVLDPKRETMHGAIDSLQFYSQWAPPEMEYIGLYFDEPYSVLANDNWAGLFRSSKGWPSPTQACVDSTILSSSHYLIGWPNSERLARGGEPADSIIRYQSGQFDAVASNGTYFMLSGVGVVDEHYVVLPDTADTETPWTESITFDYHKNTQTTKDVWSKVIGKQLMAQMKVGTDTIYFHPNDAKTFITANALNLSRDFRLTHDFTYIRDAREAFRTIPDSIKPNMADTDDPFHCKVISAEYSPIDVQAVGPYIDIVDTLRVWLRPDKASKIKDYYGRWKTGADGVHLRADGSRYRDILVTTKTYHHDSEIKTLRLVPEQESYSLGSLDGLSADVRFSLKLITSHQLLDAAGNLVRVDTISIQDTTSLLHLTSATTISLSKSDVFEIGTTTSNSVRLTTLTENITAPNRDTLTVTTTVTIGGTSQQLTISVPLQQNSTQGTELIWSVVDGGQHYFIMGSHYDPNNKDRKDDTNNLRIMPFSINNSRLVRNNKELIIGSKELDGLEDRQHIRGWKWTDTDVSLNQLTLKTEYGINLYFHIKDDGITPEGNDTAASVLSFELKNSYTNSNGNYEELVYIKYGDNKWLKFNSTTKQLELINDTAGRSLFYWDYMLPEYYMLNNGIYPSKAQEEFGYNSTRTGSVQTRYKAYRDHSMLLNNQLVYVAKVNEDDIADLINKDKEWKTNFTSSIVRDARVATSSGLSIASVDTATLTTTIAQTPTSPLNVMYNDQYVNIVDTLDFRISLRENAPVYRFSAWNGVSSLNDAHLKIPLIRKTYHETAYDSIVCRVDHEEYNHAFPADISGLSDSTYTFTLLTRRHKGRIVFNVDNQEVASIVDVDADSTSAMDLTNYKMAEVRLLDEYGNKPTWCQITNKTKNTVTVKCFSNGVRSPRVAYMYFAYVIKVDGKMRYVNYRLTVSQASLFYYANNQQLIHSAGASGDQKMPDGKQYAHENKRILYYYNPKPYNEPDQNCELPVRERGFYGWWRWYREGKDQNGVDVSDTDVPDSVWQTPPRNVGVKNFPFRIIGDSVDDPERPGKKKLVTMGRYTVFYNPSKTYNTKIDPPSKSPLVYPPFNKDTVTYVVDISNYTDNLPLSMSQVNQIDTAMLEKMRNITEPTLSLREIFELHPWTEMAERLDTFKVTYNGSGPYTNEKYLEDHVVMAPIGNRLLLSTEQRYSYDNLHAKGHSESLLGYYMRDDNWSTWGTDTLRKDTMIWCAGWKDDNVDCKWYTYNPSTKMYEPCDYTINADEDFLEVPAKGGISTGHEFDTLYYCLRARSKASTFTGTVPSTQEGQYMFNICRYKVIYHDTQKYGPKEEKTTKGVLKAIITNDEIEQDYEVLERLNFDYNKPGSDYTIYPHPLPWADASYGYTYPLDVSLPHNRYHAQADFPGPGEYGIINRIPYDNGWWRKFEQHGGAENGYMIYCDGMSAAGQVAALSLKTNLCEGQKLYFSGYVGNVSKQKGKSNPNFTFSVQGMNQKTKEWEDISSYMTGELPQSANWYQIFFPIEHEHAYEHFRVRIYNMASDFDGNDFIIDDMCIFATKPPLIAYQAQTKCMEQNENDSLIHVVLRVDYQGFIDESYNNSHVYYTVEKMTKDSVQSFVPMIDKYVNDSTAKGADASKPDTIFGWIPMPSHNYDPSDLDSVFVNLNQLAMRFEQSYEDHEQWEKDGKVGPEPELFREGYIYENLDGNVRPVLYVVHKAKMTADNFYHVRMSLGYQGLMDSKCAMTSQLKVTNRMMLMLNGEEQMEKEVDSICGNVTYDLSLRVRGTLIQDSVAPIDLTGSCYNDWLLYGDTAEASSYARYGHYYSDIVKVVKDILRFEAAPGETKNANQFAHNLGSVNRNVMNYYKGSQQITLKENKEPYDILADLVNKGFLILYQSDIMASVGSGDSVQYVIFPILGTGSDDMHSQNMEVCPSPLVIKLKSKVDTLGAPMVVGGLHRDSTLLNRPIIVLADAFTVADGVAVPVDSIRTMIGVRSAELISTDDPNYREGVHKLAMEPDRKWPADAENYYQNGDTMLLTPASTNTYQMQPGYRYTYNLEMVTPAGETKNEDGCPIGNVPFTISYVPDYLRWNPQSTESNKWNDPYNWIGINQQNKAIHADANFVPLPSSKVVIPAMSDGLPYPVIPASIGVKDSVQEVGFAYNTCDAIRFLPGAAIGQQQNLKYNNAIVDMTLPHNKWALRSSPVNGMVSGDVFMAEADLLNNSNPWEVGEFDAAGRSYTVGNASFWLSVYSRETKRVGNGDQVADTARVAVADWSKVTNALTLPLPSGQGWAVYARTATEKDAQVRLPKKDDRYYYFYKSGGRVEDKYEDNIQALRDKVAGTSTAGKLAYYPTKSSSESYTITNDTASTGARIETTSFIFGNPTMGYIDIWGFIADNGLVEEFRYIGSDGNWKEPVTKGTAATTTDTISTIERYLPPMQAIEVHAPAAVSTKTFELNTNRVVTDHRQIVRPLPSASPAPKRATASIKKGIMTITATNPVSPRCVSRLLLGQGYNKEIIKGEDAMLTTVNIDNYSNTSYPATPFNIYAVEDGQGLSVNLLDTITYVPLSFYMSDLPFEPITYLWFTGVNKIGGRLFLYDALTDTERPIMDGICLAIETPEISHQRRYYIRREGPVPTVPDDPIDPISTDIENVTNSTPLEAYKIIHNGHVYIIRNGHVYTMFGQKVR